MNLWDSTHLDICGTQYKEKMNWNLFQMNLVEKNLKVQRQIEDQLLAMDRLHKTTYDALLNDMQDLLKNNLITAFLAHCHIFRLPSTISVRSLILGDLVSEDFSHQMLLMKMDSVFRFYFLFHDSWSISTTRP